MYYLTLIPSEESKRQRCKGVMKNYEEMFDKIRYLI